MENDQAIRVLMVEDEQPSSADTAAILNRRGFTVTTAANGREAFAAIGQDAIDVVILDLMLPEMGSGEVLRELKRRKPELPVILLTGAGRPDSALAGLADGVFDCLSKPCNLDLLARRLRDAFARRRRLSEQEHRVKDVMVPLTSFSSIRNDRSVAEAIEVIMLSFNRTPPAATVQASMHRSILVLDRQKVIGLVSFTDLLQGLLASALSSPAGTPPANGSPHGPAFPQSGAFTLLTRDLAQKLVREVMTPLPITLDAEATLLEAAHRMLELRVRRLLVQDNGKTVGVIREQDLFFEMATIIREQLV